MMVRVLLCLAIVAWQFSQPRDTYSRPPDKVAYSPVPPLESAQVRRSRGVVRAGYLFARPAHEQGWMLYPPPSAANSRGARSRPQSTPAKQSSRLVETSEADWGFDEDSQRFRIWNSPEMLGARDAVMEFCQRSTQTTTAEGERFLERLLELPPDQMREWLERFQTRQRNATRRREVEASARRLTVERSMQQQEAFRQNALKIAELRSQAAAKEQYPGPLRMEEVGFTPYGEVVSIGFARGYDPLEVVVDPASPRGYSRRVAAAMSLPGDLPPGDPRNFIRGEEGVDFGEWATTREAEPPIPPVPPPATP